MYRYCNVLVLSFFLVAVAQANVEAYSFDDPQKEARYKELIAELRCLVCQNQNLAESNAGLAQDLRRQTYEMVVEGKTEKEISDYMVQRYGDFVLYRPPLQSNTVLLWIGPFAFLLIAVFVLIRLIRARASQTAVTFSDSEKAKAEQLLSNKDQQE